MIQMKLEIHKISELNFFEITLFILESPLIVLRLWSVIDFILIKLGEGVEQI